MQWERATAKSLVQQAEPWLSLHEVSLLEPLLGLANPSASCQQMMLSHRYHMYTCKTFLLYMDTNYNNNNNTPETSTIA